MYCLAASSFTSHHFIPVRPKNLCRIFQFILRMLHTKRIFPLAMVETATQISTDSIIRQLDEFKARRKELVEDCVCFLLSARTFQAI